MRWYYETGFRRYVRALEKVRTKAAAGQVELIGAVGGGGDSLGASFCFPEALPLAYHLSFSSSQPAPQISRPVSESQLPLPFQLYLLSLSLRSGGRCRCFHRPVSSRELAHRRCSGSHSCSRGERQEHGAFAEPSSSSFLLFDCRIKLMRDAGCVAQKPPPPESLFRSISLVLASNSSSEYTFLSTFFGQHSTLDLPPSRSATPLPLLHGAESTSGGTTTRGSSVVDEGVNGLGTAQPQSESGRTIGPEREAEREREMKEKEGRTARVVVDGLWKTVMEPALEYARVRFPSPFLAV